jgi:hypothetical protein
MNVIERFLDLCRPDNSSFQTNLDNHLLYFSFILNFLKEFFLIENHLNRYHYYPNHRRILFLSISLLFLHRSSNYFYFKSNFHLYLLIYYSNYS